MLFGGHSRGRNMATTKTKKKRVRGLNKEAVKLLRQVKDHILEEPKRLSMGSWMVIYPTGFPTSASWLPACGTVGCIAGWTVLLHDRKSWQARLRRVRE